MEENNRLLKILLLNNQPVENDETINLPADNFKVREQPENTITVRHKINKRVETVGLSNWEKMKKIYGEENYDVIE